MVSRQLRLTMMVWDTRSMPTAGEDESFATVLLPSGTPVKVAIAGQASDGMASVGLAEDLRLGAALDSLSEISSMVVEKLKAARPAKATLEFRIGFSVEAGRLVSLLASGKGDASLSVTLEWAAGEERGG
jgi:hypothetical protein